MKLGKKLLLASLIACSLSITAQASSFEETAKEYGEVVNSIPNHTDFINKFGKRFQAKTQEFANSISAGAIKEAVEKVKATNKDSEVNLTAIETILTEHKNRTKEIFDNAANVPSSVTAKALSDVHKEIHDKLKKQLTETLPSYDAEKDPFLAFLLEESKGAEAAANAFIRERDIVNNLALGRPTDTRQPDVDAGINALADATGLLPSALAQALGPMGMVIKPLARATLKNSFEISQLKLDVEQNRKDIAELRREHRKAIAQVAAMSSIDFGNVKARTIKVGAALGHYRDHTAIAVGAAVAPNDNWLINTKVATSTKSSKDVTFGLGATYEFSY